MWLLYCVLVKNQQRGLKAFSGDLQLDAWLNTPGQTNSHPLKHGQGSIPISSFCLIISNTNSWNERSVPRCLPLHNTSRNVAPCSRCILFVLVSLRCHQNISARLMSPVTSASSRLRHSKLSIRRIMKTKIAWRHWITMQTMIHGL